jgi:pimeloyl-ACP methyl ester carboxylesterase
LKKEDKYDQNQVSNSFYLCLLNHFISYKGFHWEYETFGKGEEILLAFHGFGNQSSDFKVFEASLGHKFRIISFNLPYHGNSYLDENVAGKTMSKNELRNLFTEFIHQQRIKKFSLMGYSLGGKIALQLLEFFPDQVASIFLFAPDGIRNNWSNGFVTRNRFGKKIYQRIIDDPSRFLRFVKMLKSMNLVHEKLSEFLHNSLSSREKRQQVWDVWMCFRDIKPGISKIQQIINQHNIDIHLFFGMYDQIIPPAIGKVFVRKIKKPDVLHVVEMGHIMVREKMNKYLAKIL